MTTENLRPSSSSTASSSSASSTLKRQSLSENPNKKLMALKPQLVKKRPALTDITNQKNGSQIVSSFNFAQPKPMVPCSAKIGEKKETSNHCCDEGSWNTLPASKSLKSGVVESSENALLCRDDLPSAGVPVLPAPSCVNSVFASSATVVSEQRSTGVSPSQSVCCSISLDGTMSTCDSLKSPEFECVDNENVSILYPFEKKANNSPYNSEHPQKDTSMAILPDAVLLSGKIGVRDARVDMKLVDDDRDVNEVITDPQFCTNIAPEIYQNLRASEAKKMPSMDFMERVQKDITGSMRAVLIDWLVEVTEEYTLLPETLYLTINYVDRYLSGNVMNRQKLQLLGVACMMIAAKYEEICAPAVEEFCYITDNTYFKKELLQMESAVLNYLKFEMTVPTAKCFSRLLVQVARRTKEVPAIKFECLLNYIMELSLVEYDMLRYAPSLIAASATFLAKFILFPYKRPWSSTLLQYTLYQPSDLYDCVKTLHRLCLNSGRSNLPAVREKYSQHKYKFVAKKYCPISIPPEYFQDISK